MTSHFLINDRPTNKPIVSADAAGIAPFKSIFYVMLLIFGSSLFGSFTRPIAGNLATVWAGNALLLGLILRCPHYNKWYIWLTAYLSYILADFLTGVSVNQALIVNLVNLVGVSTGVLCNKLMPFANRLLDTPQSVLRYFTIVFFVSVTAGIVGGFSNPIVFPGSSFFDGFRAWFTGELVNYMTILPIVLSYVPHHNRFGFKRLRKSLFLLHNWKTVMPAFALVVSLVCSHFIGGPGSIAFAVPTLLWCSITYNLFTMSILNTLFSFTTLISLNYLQTTVTNIHFGPDSNVISMRIGVTMITLAPILVCSIMKSRNDLLSQLEHYATHDFLTGVLNRSGIDYQYHKYRMHNPNAPTGLLVMDIDYFKKINDTYGHEAGDIALKEFTNVINSGLRESDIFGRTGGEEFVAILPFCHEDELQGVAERLCSIVESTPVRISNGSTMINVTVSIGGIIVNKPYEKLDLLFAEADKELYYVKNHGRNCVKISRFDPAFQTIVERNDK